MKQEEIQLLRKMPIFGGIEDETIAFLLERTRAEEAKVGEYFFKEGDQADCMYVIHTGRVLVVKAFDEKELKIRYLDPGDCFGEMALIDMLPRSASVKAVEDSTVLILTTTALEALYKHDLEQFTLLQMNLSRELSRRLRIADKQILTAMSKTQQLDEDIIVYCI